MDKQISEEREARIGALRQALIDGENSGDAGRLDMKAIEGVARRLDEETYAEVRDSPKTS